MPEDRLATLLHDAVADVEPADRLDDIRARTTRASRPSARPWFYGGAAVLAAAATVVAVALVSTSTPHRAEPAHPGPDSTPSPTTTSAPTPSPAPAPTQTLVPAYYIGDTPDGPRLFREFDGVAVGDPLEGARSVLQSHPSDPDYRSAWPAGSITSAGFDGVGDDGEISVVLDRSAMLHRPEGLSAAEAGLALQQVVYTFQAGLQSRAPVRFYYGPGVPADEVYGVPTPDPVANAPQADVLSQVMISDPAEGLEVHGSFTARGVADSFEGNVPWEVRDDAGDVVAHGFATAEGFGRLYPWQTRVDVSDLPFGFYTFVAMTDDPSGGAEGSGADSDTRTIIVR